MEEQEIWKDIKGYESSYQVSSLGRVKSLKRKTNNQFGREDKILPLRTVFNNRYVSVPLSLYGEVIEHNVHVLVAVAFLDYTSKGWKFIVDHISNNSLDNRAINLQIISQRKNCIKEIDKSLTHSKYTGVTHHPDRIKYYAAMKIGKRSVHLGTHPTNQEYLRDLYLIAVKYKEFYTGDSGEFRSFIHYMYIEEGYPLINTLITINLKDMKNIINKFTKGNIRDAK